MTRITKYTYDVRQNERVAFIVTPLNGASSTVTAAQNGETIDNTGSANRPKFEVLCDEFVGNNHFVKIEFAFLPGAPSTAEFALRARSNDGDQYDDFPNIKKKNTARTRNFTLRVKR